jgi:hypothetical protein
VDKGFSEVERSPLDESDGTDAIAGIDALDERPRKSRVSKNTIRIPRTNRKPQVALALLILAGAAAWALRDRLLPSGSMAPPPVSVRPTPPPPPPHADPAKAPPETEPAAAELKPEPAPAQTAAKPAAGGPLLGLAPAPSKALDKAAPTRTRLGPGATAGATASFATTRSEPRPSAPPPLPPVPAPPAPPALPTPVAAPAEATVDIEALLRDAQQAWSKQYYAVAIGKAEAALKIDPGRQAAYQIIAVCSCALRRADAAQQAISHLDEHKRRMVQTLCQRHGVTLE